MSDTNAPTNAPAAPAGPQIPSDYEELRTFRDTYRPVLEQIAPYVDDIRPILEDEDSRTFWRSARETYEQRKKAMIPEIDPALQPVIDKFETRLGPIVGYLEEEKKTREEAAAAKVAEEQSARDAAQAANVAYAQRLAAERPDLAEDEYAGIGMLAAYAANRKISLEEAWNRKGNSLGAPPKREKPPASLRGDAAAPGVPGESKEPPIRSAGDLRKRLANNLRAAGMKG